MSPDENFEKQRQEKEAERLQQAVSVLSEQEKEMVYQKGQLADGTLCRGGALIALMMLRAQGSQWFNHQ